MRWRVEQFAAGWDDAVLLVVTSSARVARWARSPIPLGHPGTTLTPLVIGPDDVPIVEDATLALADPELGVLSAIVHGQRCSTPGSRVR